MKIEADEYKEAQAAVLGVARLVYPLPLAAMLEAIDRASTVGPFVDPTLWREGQDAMARIRILVSRLRDFQAEVEDQLSQELAAEPQATVTQIQPEGPGLACPDCGVRFEQGSDLFSHACQTEPEA